MLISIDGCLIRQEFWAISRRFYKCVEEVPPPSLSVVDLSLVVGTGQFLHCTCRRLIPLYLVIFVVFSLVRIFAPYLDKFFYFSCIEFIFRLIEGFFFKFFYWRSFWGWRKLSGVHWSFFFSFLCNKAFVWRKVVLGWLN